MDKDLVNRQTLIQYLLGELSEEQRANLAERYFEDEEWFEELLDVENELLDRYASGSLGENQRQAFKSYLERLPDGQQKAAVARLLTQISDDERARAQEVVNQSVPVPPALWQRLRNWPARPRLIRQVLIPAGLLILAIGVGILWFQIKQLGHDNEQLRAQLANLQSENEALEQNAQANDNDKRLRQLEEQLNLEQQVSEAQAQQLASLHPPTPLVTAWMLTATVRSGNRPDSVTLPRHTKFVSITMPVESEEKLSRFRAIIQTTTGAARREVSGLQAHPSGKAVSLKLPAKYFTETSYKITLIGHNPYALEMAQDHYFTITRR